MNHSPKNAIKPPQRYTSFSCMGCEITSVPLEKDKDSATRNPRSAMQQKKYSGLNQSIYSCNFLHYY
ncbi:hypothetical protein MSWHS_2519 [Methanosarcina sp. WWM596]|nr:hypothetical protein MSWHS_2519 [Methanosarcina sp. WWM596]